MTIRFGACAFATVFFIIAPHSANASCGQNDLACQKFSGNSQVKKPAIGRNSSGYHKRQKTRRARRTVIQEREAVVSAVATTATAPITNQEPTNANISTALPTAELRKLAPGTISEAPNDLPSLTFGNGDQVELATAKCSAIERSNRRVTCAVAVHRLAMTSEAGAGCVGSLGLRKIEFVKTDEGNWVNEDSIALCGGRLLRRTEMFPVAINGTPRYALREQYEMRGGDRACAAPYLKSRHPLQKSYLPGNRANSVGLRCGTVASR